MEQDQVRELFERHQSAVCRLTRLVGAADPEDVAAEAFARLLSNRRRVRSPEAALAYVRRTAVNLIRDEARRSRLARAAPTHDAVFAGDPYRSAESFDARIYLAVRRLSQRQREAVILRYWLDLSEKDTAAVMDVSAGSVKKHLSRALGSLRADLKGIDDE